MQRRYSSVLGLVRPNGGIVVRLVFYVWRSSRIGVGLVHVVHRMW